MKKQKNKSLLRKQKTIIKDYKRIMNNSYINPYSNDFVWSNPNDLIQKFSLFEDTPNSIASTNTLVNIKKKCQIGKKFLKKFKR
jgi:hypothetical protein